VTGKAGEEYEALIQSLPEHEVRDDGERRRGEVLRWNLMCHGLLPLDPVAWFKGRSTKYLSSLSWDPMIELFYKAQTVSFRDVANSVVTAAERNGRSMGITWETLRKQLAHVFLVHRQSLYEMMDNPLRYAEEALGREPSPRDPTCGCYPCRRPAYSADLKVGDRAGAAGAHETAAVEQYKVPVLALQEKIKAAISVNGEWTGGGVGSVGQDTFHPF
jgi:hypothetical protein